MVTSMRTPLMRFRH